MNKLAELNTASYQQQHIIACDNNCAASWLQFLADIDATRREISAHNNTKWALFEDDAYYFTVGLLALLAENKRVYLPGENNAAVTETLKGLGASFLGMFPAEDSLFITSVTGTPTESVTDLSLTGELVVFTSGTTGKPKAICKSLAQIDAELEILEQTWGDRLGQSLILSGVSHHHFYGLLFIILWPLCAGRTYWRKRFDNPATLMNEAVKHDATAWIMSPAYLHRLDADLPWAKTTKSTTMVFSSGGLLKTSAAMQLKKHLGQYPCEVLGSSETGGIAWREQRAKNYPWTTFPCISIAQDKSGALKIQSPYLPDSEWCVTDDAVEIQSDGRFLLGERLDRIVKIEGKRVSLPVTEKTLADHPWVKEVYSVPLTRRRQCVGALLVPTDDGLHAYQALGHHKFGLTLRKHCLQQLAAAAAPRYFRLTDALPQNAQGKILQDAVLELFAETAFPRILYQERKENGYRLVLLIDANSPFFKGHFPGTPILPGVTQLFWAEHFARTKLGLKGKFQDMRHIKFRNLVRPGTELALNLNWFPEKALLTFTYESRGGPHSQGKMMFRGKE